MTLSDNIISVIEEKRHYYDDKPKVQRPDEKSEEETEENAMAKDKSHRNPQVKTPEDNMNEAVKQNNDVRVGQLLASGVDAAQLYNGTTFLHTAVNHNSYEAAKKLLAHGVYADAMNKAYETPLFTAVTSNNVDMADLLLKSDANPHLCVKGNRIEDYSKSKEMADLIYTHKINREKNNGQTRGKTR
jgi:ankyrin repeat protein